MSSFSDDIKAEFRKPNNVVVQLIIVNIAVWVLLNINWVLGAFNGLESITSLVRAQFIFPPTIQGLLYKPWTAITSFFSHEGFSHILFNMIGLWFFGRRLQDLVGSNRILGIYFLGGLVGGLSYFVFGVVLGVLNPGAGALGASAAVYAIMVALATLAPNYNVQLIFIGNVQIKWIVLIYVFMSFIGLRSTNAGGEIAHLGGTLMGFIFVKQLQAGRDLGRPIVNLIYAIPNLFKKKSKLKVSHKSTRKTTTESSTNINQAEIDQILDKISASGYSSLSKDEKEKLFKYSNKKN